MDNYHHHARSAKYGREYMAKSVVQGRLSMREAAAECAQLNLKHRRTRPYTPRTNGKAERFIQTAINEWACARTYQNSEDRTSWLPIWTHRYNCHRPHASLNQQPPISRADLDDNNLLTHLTWAFGLGWYGPDLQSARTPRASLPELTP